jgi:serine protease Do/serine protease DegQ
MKRGVKLIAATLCVALSSLPTLAEVPASASASAPEGAPMPSLAPVVKRASPAVVNIATAGTIKERAARGNPLMDDPFFRQFFGEQPEARPRERRFQSEGSGVIIDAKNGYIVTNFHVVQNASEIKVTLLDNRNVDAKVLGSDEGSDIALLQVKEPNLVAMALGDSSRLEVGDYVVAIGNPFGLQHTVTAGIVSALGRSGINPDGYEDFIQTDASINPGNSGGALVNLRGELVGINSAIYSQSGGNIGIGFAIPVNMVKLVVDQLVKYGTVRRGVLGVSVYPVSPEIAKQYGLAEANGALVAGIVPGSSAERAGIKSGDIITSLNGTPIKGAAELRNTIGLLGIGEKVEIGLLRDGKPRKLVALVAERSVPQTVAANRLLDGVEFSDAPQTGGVLVKAVRDGSTAAIAGLRSGDVIIGIGREPINNTRELREVSKDAPFLQLIVRRGSLSLLIPLR